MAPTNKNPNMTKKQTGTVPKASSTSTTSVIPAQNKTAGTGKTSSSRKNTEIVAPTRRELNDLNDYLLSVAESTKQENSRGHTTHLDPTCFELDNLNFQENQRSCWPVRPIPRRNIINKKSSSSGVQQGHPTTTNVGHHTNYLGINNNTVISTASNINHPAAIGVVIPTTPNSTVLEDSFNLNRVHSNLGNNQIHLNGDDLNSNHQIQQQLQSNINFDNDLSWEQRLNFIQYFLSLTSKSINKTSNSSLLYNLQFPLVDLCLKNSNHKMVNEYKDGDIYMNSTSLEDVAHSEASDTRAQSVTSIHTNAPETPSYEDLQTRLEASNRNIQNIKDQQQQLIQLQQSAKQHLSEMESIRNQHNKQPARYNQNGSGGGPPNYETVEQVHSDMSNLVNRMKNLQNFIHGQNELSAMLGDDGPEIMAEQEALQKKLEELKSQKQDMKNLVSELQEINNSAERSLINQQSTEENVGRSVPIDYERVVPIEMVGATKQPIQQNGLPNGHYHNGVSSYNETSDQEHLDQNIDEREEAIAETNDMIAQKIADINTMKSQLKRLKDMMETVSLIEAKNDGKTAKEIADEGETPTSTLPPSVQIPIVPKNPSRGGSIPADKDESATATTEEEAVMSERVRLLHEMTQDLRDQAVHLSSERDRLKAIKDEMQRRKEMESAINHDKIPNRQPSLDRIPNNAQQSKESDKHLIKEFEAKKKEFEKLCQRLQNEDELVRDEEVESIAPDGTETGELKRENASYYPDNWRQSHIVSSNSSVHGKQSAVPLTPTRGKDSADSGAVDVHGVASLEGGSFQSGSSRSFSMPPPMRNITRDTPWRKNSQDNNSQSQFDHYAPPPPPLPAWNPSFYYSTPYSQQFSPPCHHHMMMSANNNAASEYFCPHQFHSNAVNSTISTATQQQQQQQQVSTQNTGVTSSDPVLLQQFIQTQQMLINSVCQCNQLLWHQQREINNLNNAVLLLQERLLNSNTSDIAATLNASIRAESVPPTGVTVSNNLYTQANRAQSEQPHPGVLPSIQPYSSIQQHGPPPPPPMSPGRQYQSFNYATNSYQQHNRRHMTNILQQNHVVPGSNHSMHSSNSAYNFSATEAAATTGYCSQLPPPHGGVSNSGSQSIPYNNTNVHHQGQTNFLNNDVLPNGPPPPPIFMHHHNNTITPSVCNANVQQQQQQPQPHHNNSNLNIQPSQQQQQNCLNSPSMNSSRSAANINAAVTSSAPNTTNSNAADVAAALNNQVPPGNRANNYWDNFRSYSRQNLLSSNSCKSNEEQQHQHQQQQQQHLSTSLFGTNSTSLNTNGIRNLHYLNIGESSGNSSTNSINLTPPIFDNKYSHTFRNQFNNNIVGGGGTTGSVGVNVGNVQHPQELNTVMIPPINNIQNGPTNILNSIDNMEIIETNQPQQQLQHQSTSNNINNINNINNNNNNNNHNNINNNLNNNTTNSNNVAAIFGSSDFRNMNFNFGINESRKKLPFKTSCNTKRLRHTQQMLNDVNNVVGPNQRYPGNHDGNNDIIGINNNNNNNNTDFYIRQELNNGQSSSSSTSLLRDNHTNMMSERMSDNMNEVVSEEIKRNLLVNALKSDKFTSKFFESLKEDVYREVYTIIQATESHPYYLMQLFKELQLISSSDPLRNIVIQAMHDLYKRSCTNNQSGNEETLLDQHENDEDLHENQSQPPTQSSYENDFENLHSNNNDNEIMNSLLNSQELRRLAYKIMFESSTSPTRIDKTKKMDIKKTKTATKSSSTASPKFQYVHEIYRPNYELINQIMSDIRNLIFTQQQQQQQKIDDDLMIRIAKLTYTSLENHELTMNTEHNNYVQIDRHLIIPKELYRKMRTFDISNCDGFLSCYESYLQTLFIMKCINDDTINNVNLINKTPTATTAATSTAAHDEISIDMNPSSSSTSSLINENDQKSRRHSQITSHKSNIPINSIELNLGLNKKIHHDNNDGDCSSSSINMASCSTSTQDSSQQTLQHNPHHCHSQNLITSSDISLIFGNGIISSSGQSTDQISSPCTSNNMMNEDLAEADQICSTSSTTNSCSLVLQPLQSEGNPNPIESRCSTTPGRGSFSLEHPIKRPLIEDYLDEHEIIGEKEKKDCGGIGGNINHNNCSSNNNNNNNMKMNGGGGSSLTYQTNYNREAQVNSNARREMDEDGFDVFGKVGGSTTAATTTTTTSSIFGKLYQNNGPEVMITNNCVLNPMSTVSSIDSDIGNNNPDIVGNCVAAIPIMNDAACAVVYATSSNSSLDTTSTINLSNSLSDSNSNGINHNNMILTNNHHNNPCGGGGDTTTKQRNSVP